MTRIEPPDWRAIVRERLGAEPLRPEAVEECVEELAQHLESAYQELRAGGAAPEHARAQLMQQLDSKDLAETIRGRSRTSATLTPGVGAHRGWRATSFGDVRYALRSLRRAPVLTAVIVLSLGLVIGANTAIFGLIDALVLRRLTLPDAHELVAIRTVHKGLPHSFEYRQLLQVREAAELPGLQAFRIEAAAVRTPTDSVDAWIDMVSGGYFQLLGVSPLLGRLLTPEDELRREPVVVVSEDFWRTYFRGDSGAVGQPLRVGLVTATVVGVLPRSFTGIHFARRLQVAVPISLTPSGFTDPGTLQVNMIARRSLSVDNFARLEAVIGNCCIDPRQFGFAPPRGNAGPRARPDEPPPYAQLRGLPPADSAAHISVVDISRGVAWDTDYRGRYSKMLFALAAGGAILLLIACVNIATLLVSRAAARSRDFAIRLALGASRRRVAMQLFTESLVLALSGAILGMLVAQIANRLLLANLPPVAARLSATLAWQPGSLVFLFTTGIVILCTLLVGLWPARGAARADVAVPLAGGTMQTARSRRPIGSTLVSIQVACTIVLVVLGALFATTLRELTRSEGGYRTRDVLVARIAMRVPDTAAAKTINREKLLREMLSLPEVQGAALTVSAPLVQDGVTWMKFTTSGAKPGRADSMSRSILITPGYFAASGIGMQEGREFTPADIASGEPLAILSASMAKRHFPNGAVGARIGLSFGTARVIGVARDARYDKLAGEPSLRRVDEEVLYVPIADAERAGMPNQLLQGLTLVVRSSGDPIHLIPAVRTRIATTAPELQIPLITTVGQLLDNLTVGERFLAALMNVFAALAMLLASAGVFGIMSYQVTRRRREIGVRMALGARPTDAVWLVMRNALTVAGVGAAVGILLAIGAGHAVRAQLYGVSATNPMVMAFAALLLITVAVLAALIPSRRAASVDPMIALRAD